MQIEIRVTEVLSRVVTINASSTEEALMVVENMYKNQEIVLDEFDFNGDTIIEENIDNDL